MKKQLRVGTSPLTNKIFCGHVLKNGFVWAANKTDITGAALGAVAEHVVRNGGPVTINCNGKPRFEITVREIPEPTNGEEEGKL